MYQSGPPSFDRYDYNLANEVGTNLVFFFVWTLKKQQECFHWKFFFFFAKSTSGMDGYGPLPILFYTSKNSAQATIIKSASFRLSFISLYSPKVLRKIYSVQIKFLKEAQHDQKAIKTTPSLRREYRKGSLR